MVIKNLTCKSQKLVVKELTGDHREYYMILQPNSTSDLDRLLTVVHPEQYSGIFEFDGCTCQETVEDPKEEESKVEEEESKVEEEDPKEEESKVEEEDPKEEEKAQDSYVCEICGAEFASSRGLLSHKNRAHAQ